MKKLAFVLLTLLVAGTFQACNNRSHQDAVEKAEDSNQVELDSANMPATIDSYAADFAVKAASGGMMEVMLGEMAEKKGVSSRVKNFGSMMVTDHTKANDELKSIAASKNITLPTALGEDQQKHVDDLAKKTGVDFDKAYMSLMADDHKTDVDEFDKASKDIKDADIRDFATKTLPVLRIHLDSAKVINDAIKGK